MNTSQITSKITWLQTYWRLMQRSMVYWKFFALGIMGAVLLAAAEAGLSWLTKPIVDQGFINRDPVFVYWLPVFFMLLFIFKGVFNFIASYFISKVANNMIMEFRQRIFAHLLCLPASFFDTQASGRLITLMTYSVAQLTRAITVAFLNILRDGLILIGSVVVMFVVSWQLTLLFLAFVPIIALLMHYVSRRMRCINIALQKSIAAISHITEEMLEGYKVIRMFSGERYERDKFAQMTQNNRRLEMKLQVTSSVSSSVMQIVAALPIAIAIYLTTAAQTSISPGSFVTMIVAMLRLLQPIKGLARSNEELQAGLTASKRIFELLDIPREVDQGRIPLVRSTGHIHAQKVSFTYPQSDKPVLDSVSFEIQPGQMVALVGSSGSGKSTLMRLLPRFYNIDSGSILLDGIPLEQYRLSALRQQYALVSQDITLFNDTIACNIAYGFPEIDTAAIIRAAEMAHAMNFIRALPQGMETVVGENGVLLSGGQRQRIAIARAILKKAPILLLDEATSALDSEVELHIQDALKELMSSATTLVIAHRLSTIESADHILVLSEGRIIESGRHLDLLGQNGHYARLYALQYAHRDKTHIHLI